MTETGTDHIQVLPDNPRAGLVEPFRGLGYGQLLSTGMFEFTRHRRIRSLAERLLRLPHSSISRGKDGTLRFTFIIKQSDAQNFCRWLQLETKHAIRFFQGHKE